MRYKLCMRDKGSGGLGDSLKNKIIWSSQQTMDPNSESNPTPTETRRRSFAPSKVSAYLDPQYW